MSFRTLDRGNGREMSLVPGSRSRPTHVVWARHVCGGGTGVIRVLIAGRLRAKARGTPLRPLPRPASPPCPLPRGACRVGRGSAASAASPSFPRTIPNRRRISASACRPVSSTASSGRAHAQVPRRGGVEARRDPPGLCGGQLRRRLRSASLDYDAVEDDLVITRRAPCRQAHGAEAAGASAVEEGRERLAVGAEAQHRPLPP
jgi:hypothetical protein